MHLLAGKTLKVRVLGPDAKAVAGARVHVKVSRDDGVLSAGEKCDTGIAPGAEGACPAVVADCDDGDACTADALLSAGTC